MRLPVVLASLASIGAVTSAKYKDVITSDDDPLPSSVREKWMRVAVEALSDLKSTPCPFEAFGCSIVNHTASEDGELICIGVNSIRTEGNPTLHGEIAAINNCSAILTSPDGPYKLSPEEALQTYSQLSLYTTAEACPMCAAAIRQAGFAEYIYATDMHTLIELGWSQIEISSREIFERSPRLGKQPRILGRVLGDEETDQLFGWQFKEGGKCPSGCERSEQVGGCQPLREKHDEL